MMIFWVLLLLMLIIALGFIVLPWVIQQSSMTAQMKKLSFLQIIIISLLMILFSLSWYYVAGNSQALAKFCRKELIEKMLSEFKSPQEVIDKLREHLEHHPASAKGWYLLGRLYYTTGDMPQAVASFAKANELKPHDKVIEVQYAQAKRQLILISEPQEMIHVTISLDQKVKSLLAPSETVFIYARALNGPRMPLAIRRYQVKDLPIMTTLSNAEAMNPAFSLSQFQQVRVIARISRSGEATPQKGDYYGESRIVDLNDAHKKVKVRINQLMS